ncbi:MAG TPA: hypothetical protein VN258_02270 [Mobilitalea sp.]|nr:hypothetical protein [Mobilitalea sp.]
MAKLIRTNKKIFLLLIIFCDVILICSLYVKRNVYQNKVMTAAYLRSSDTQDKYEQLLVNTYLTRITEASDHFYDEYYTISPIVNYYSVSVKEISSDQRTSFITFTSNPYLGPHDTIGIDEITFSADYLGNVKLEKFNHLISYHLPDNLKDLEKKKVPGKYNED